MTRHITRQMNWQVTWQMTRQISGQTLRHAAVALTCLLFTAAASAQTEEGTPPVMHMGAGSSNGSGYTTGAGGNAGQTAGQPGIYVQLPMPAQQNASTLEPAKDPTAYCYYADKSYSEGSRLRDQVCVRPGNTGGGYEASTQLAPLRWISASQYARGKY